ncbi:hypothetical protein [Streptomyces sp. NPDC087856]|uniref:hypothetical protein n=1 Tax=Streptomyces sp. NPDC087856 TaxID=3365811 RepID=UPI00381E8159
MDAAYVTAIGVIVSAAVAGAAAVHGSRVAGRAQREGTALTGYDNLTQRLVAERDKAETDQARAEDRVEVLELEVARLRQLVIQLGGTP